MGLIKLKRDDKNNISIPEIRMEGLEMSVSPRKHCRNEKISEDAKVGMIATVVRRLEHWYVDI